MASGKAWEYFIPGLREVRMTQDVINAGKNYINNRRASNTATTNRVENPAAVQKGVKRVTVNGKTIEGNVLPLAPAGETVEVTVVMG